tara:strand:- start:40 stop:450 length:411 start_codon:yes stop_codon:yes gene_type:complete
MRIEISGSASSGLMTIQSDDSWAAYTKRIDRFLGCARKEDHGFLFDKPKRTETIYDFSPWCIITTDHHTYMKIRTLSHESNNYNEGHHEYDWSIGRFEKWYRAFNHQPKDKDTDISWMILETLSAQRNIYSFQEMN